LPLVMLFVNRIGLVSVQTYVEKWRIAIMVIFVFWDVRDDASERESIWCRCCHKRLSEETVRRIWPEVVFWAV